MRTVDYVDQVRKLTETGSDYAVAKLLGISEDAVHGYRKRGHAMSVDIAARVAEVLGVPVLQIIADVQLERATDEATRARWAKLRKTAGRQAAGVLFAIAAAVTTQDGDASYGRESMSVSDSARTPPTSNTSNNYATFWRIVLRTLRQWFSPLTTQSTPV